MKGSSSSSLLLLLCLAPLLAGWANAFLAGPHQGAAARGSSRQQQQQQMSTRLHQAGFGKKPEKPADKPKSKGQVQRDEAAKAYDSLVGSGAPEYIVWTRGVGTEDWLPAGTMAIPRSEKISNVVYERQEELREAALRKFKFLKDAPLEWAYTNAVYPDDAPRPLELKAPSEDIAVNWFERLISPINPNNT